MYSLVRAMKKEAEYCCEICGGINEKELYIINYVGQRDNVKMSEIAADMALPMSTLTSIIDKLVEKKYLERYHSNEDRRVINVALGTRGKETCHIFMEQQQQMARRVLSDLDEKEQDQLIRYLEKMPDMFNQKK